MKKIRVLIVDDEIAQRTQLRERLASLCPQVEVLAECKSAEEATIALARYSPELVFLDVEMPGMSGFDFLDSLSEIRFSVIFTTSHAGYAVRAFRVAAVDFLLKPYSDEDLNAAVLRFEKSRQNAQDDHLQLLIKNLKSGDDQKIALPTSSGFVFVRTKDIIRLESQNTYTTFFLKDKNQIVVSRTLKDCEELLSDAGFLRIHQSHMINMSFIRKFTRGEGGTVEMEDGTSVEISRRKKEEFLEALKKL